MGTHPELEVSKWPNPFPLRPDDRFLLCSDGLYDMIPDTELASIAGSQAATDACRRLIDLAKRAGQRRGWATGTFDLYGKPKTKRHKTFVATWRPAGGAIRVVRVDEPTGWVAYFCTDPAATVAAVWRPTAT